MWRSTAVLLGTRRPLSSTQYRNLKHKIHKRAGSGMQQHLMAREQRITKFIMEKNIEPTSDTRRQAERLLFGKNQSDRQQRNLDATDFMQNGGYGAGGERTSLSQEREKTRSMFEKLTGERLRSDASGDVPFTPLMSRRMRSGELWPSAPETSDRIKFPRFLRNEDSSSRSSNKHTAMIEYHLRRSLKAMPQHLAEQLEFSEIMIDRVTGSARSKEIYIVWSTVNPGYRVHAEPVLLQSTEWVKQLILRRVRNIPNIPKINWVYNTGLIPEELSMKTQKDLKRAYDDAQDTIEDRVQVLRAADSVAYKTRNIDWFMPYLWNKDKKAMQENQMRKDFSSLKKQQELKMRKLEQGRR